MRITPLSSGSQGNSLLVEAAGLRLLVDQGLDLPAFTARLAVLGLSPRELDGVLLTHRHKDHIRGVAPLAELHSLPVYGTRRTLRALSNKLHKRLRPIVAGRPFRIGDLDLRAVLVCHDAPETVAWRVDDGRHRFGIATDLGCAAGELRDVFVHLDALLLEFNHDEAMLENGPYHAQLRARVGGDRGHLSNRQAAALLGELASPRLQQLWLGHLSRKNNRGELARAAAQAALDAAGLQPRLEIAIQDGVSASWSAD